MENNIRGEVCSIVRSKIMNLQINLNIWSNLFEMIKIYKHMQRLQTWFGDVTVCCFLYVSSLNTETLNCYLLQ